MFYRVFNVNLVINSRNVIFYNVISTHNLTNIEIYSFLPIFTAAQLLYVNIVVPIILRMQAGLSTSRLYRE